MNRVLEVIDISKSIDGAHILADVSFTVSVGEIVALVGPNGSGKTSTIDVVSCLSRPDRGDVRLGGVSLLSMPPQRLPALGVGRVFQRSQVSRGMTVAEDLGLARFWEQSPAERLRRFRPSSSDEVLSTLGLESAMRRPTVTLSYAERRYVELARATYPARRLLLLDEPSTGLTLAERKPIIRTLELLRCRGVAILLIDHDVALIRAVADKCVLLDAGSVVADGAAAEVLDSPDMRRLYLGAA